MPMTVRTVIASGAAFASQASHPIIDTIQRESRFPHFERPQIRAATTFQRARKQAADGCPKRCRISLRIFGREIADCI
jgi:hypothetical protein